MPVPENLRSYWDSFVLAHPDADESRWYEAFAFGDSEGLAHELAQLVLQGIKRATAGSLWAVEHESKPLPKPGDLSIVTNWAGAPLCVIETLAVDVLPFVAVPAEFAAAEGEGDGSLAFWRDAHRAYFARECGRIGRPFTETMPVVCERFRVVFQGGRLEGEKSAGP